LELETVMNDIANSMNLDGVCAVGFKKALDVTAELGHAQILARRIKTVGAHGRLPRLVIRCAA
jgi:bacterioferritin